MRRYGCRVSDHSFPTKDLRQKLTTYSEIEHIWQTIYRIGFYRGGPVMMSALSGVDIALWDLKGTIKAVIILESQVFLTR